MAHNRHFMNAQNAVDSFANGSDRELYNGWMSQFCVEPREAGTQQMKVGSQAMAVMVLVGDGIITGLQRAQIRGTYGIEGTCASDIALGVFCPSCTQIQNDREVRAREGDTSMRYNPKYLHDHQKVVSHQPRPQIPMTYISPRQASEHSTDNPLAHAHSHKETPKKLQKHFHKTAVGKLSPASHLRNVEERNPYQPYKEPSSQRSEKKYPMPTAPAGPTILVTQHQEQKMKAEISSTRLPLSDENPTTGILCTKSRDNQKSGKKVKIFGLGKAAAPRQPNIPEETVQDGFESLSQQHELAEGNAIEVEEDITFRPTVVTNAFVECSKIGVGSPKKEHSVAAPQHTILESVTAEEITQVTSSPSDLAKHPVAECEAVAVEYTPSQIIAQHQLSECNTVPASEASTQAQELSYVHDFTDCPVDKAVLDYYEKEEKKAQEHDLTDCIRISLPTELIQANNPYAQHALADCSDNELPPASSSNLHLDPQHTLADCSEDESPTPTSPSNHRSTSCGLDTSNKKSQKFREHRLASCPTPPMASHHVAENARVNTSGESEATQRAVQKIHHSKSKEKNCADQADESMDGVNSASSCPTSQESTEDAEEVVRQHKRRHKPSRNNRKPVIQFPLATTGGNESYRSEATELSLDQFLSANGGKKEKGVTGSKSESNPATTEISGIQPESVHVEDLRRPEITSRGVLGLLSKIAGGSNDRLPH
ncbi:hypothetical protein B2J93_2753 [Marssonina coronariae]|uniref:Uncharacterized protein n=1 Tax=Diplocarpon coronariae TaxID=2795749 RepID=A0A218Z1B5_9HELO|nr:hypothetical protein B2J93_2753 [Marssonina coronariae]